MARPAPLGKLGAGEWIHAITSQILQPRQHATRSYGHYANRARGARRPQHPATRDPEDDPPYSLARKASWARLLQKILELDPLLCPRCGGVLEVIAVISDPEVIDHIVAHPRPGAATTPSNHAARHLNPQPANQ